MAMAWPCLAWKDFSGRFYGQKTCWADRGIKFRRATTTPASKYKKPTSDLDVDADIRVSTTSARYILRTE
jgi:hypothetical protein